MDKQSQLCKIASYVKNQFDKDATGHDFYHMQRVARIAKQIAYEEDADLFMTEMAAWLHDVGDDKLFANPQAAIADMNQFLQKMGLSKKQINELNQIIGEVSFRKGVMVPDRLETKIVQDADRIDAIGAIGIARTFAYGGAAGQLLYDSFHPENTSFQHFYDKLFKLKDRMHTQTGKRLAEERTQFLHLFAKEFLHEWES
ncbi:HD domain-containing protein [Virgibacillus sp. 179-BFC.A HS]|uniref:HD domain-containing protein n=1 Tax=Tigheibacillus jepli TaxID=3035914 RepID=A0ABU5CHC9_9BACI|nr:HD domain-containing protein [Virgibacillus sp. 179-BFC.A HS]MDY0405741.1 HD domain-containing protein [Virgibacillus sp. 179-BFC.A HS]